MNSYSSDKLYSSDILYPSDESRKNHYRYEQKPKADVGRLLGGLII